MAEDRLTLRTAWERPGASQRMSVGAYRTYCERKTTWASKSVTGFVPVGKELDCVVEYWLSVLLDIEWCWACGQCGGVSEHAREMFARERLNAIADAVGLEAFNDAYEVAVKNYAQQVHPGAWKEFLLGNELPDSAVEMNRRLFTVPATELRDMCE